MCIMVVFEIDGDQSGYIDIDNRLVRRNFIELQGILTALTISDSGTPAVPENSS